LIDRSTFHTVASIARRALLNKDRVDEKK
jgi:hypothetical protein